jgi:hypothetical protein
VLTYVMILPGRSLTSSSSNLWVVRRPSGAFLRPSSARENLPGRPSWRRAFHGGEAHAEEVRSRWLGRLVLDAPDDPCA